MARTRHPRERRPAPQGCIILWTDTPPHLLFLLPLPGIRQRPRKLHNDQPQNNDSVQSLRNQSQRARLRRSVGGAIDIVEELADEDEGGAGKLDEVEREEVVIRGGGGMEERGDGGVEPREGGEERKAGAGYVTGIVVNSKGIGSSGEPSGSLEEGGDGKGYGQPKGTGLHSLFLSFTVVQGLCLSQVHKRSQRVLAKEEEEDEQGGREGAPRASDARVCEIQRARGDRTDPHCHPNSLSVT